MGQVETRLYDPADLERCRALWVELTDYHRQLYNDPSIGGAEPGLYFDRHLDLVGAQRLWVAVDEGQVVGLAGLQVNERAAEGREAEVEPVVVAATHRGRGIGRALLGRVVEEARALGVRYLSVKPVARNLEAIALYHDAGFRKLGEIEMFMELEPSPLGTWKSGLVILGYAFEY